MKKSLLVISMMLVLAITVWGCATKGDLQKVQSQEMLNSAKADQAAKDAQAAKAAADAATLKAEAAAARAKMRKDGRGKGEVAEEKAKVAEEKAKEAEETFQKSMKK